MKNGIIVLLKAVFTIVGAVIGALLPFVYNVIGILLVGLIFAFPAEWIYVSLQTSMHEIVLPMITYWSWFKIIVLAKLIFGKFQIMPNFFNKKKKEVNDPKSTSNEINNAIRQHTLKLKK